jgi:hypothetical protein
MAALIAVADRLDGAGAEWLLAGSAARCLQGLAMRPRDVDLEVSAATAEAAAAALGAVLREERGGGRRSRRARARLAGVEVDLTCDLEIDGPGGLLAPDFARQRRWARRALVAGRTIALAPPEEALARAVALRDRRAVARLAAEASAAQAPPPLRRAYLAGRVSPASARAAR